MVGPGKRGGPNEDFREIKTRESSTVHFFCSLKLWPERGCAPIMSPCVGETLMSSCSDDYRMGKQRGSLCMKFQNGVSMYDVAISSQR